MPRTTSRAAGSILALAYLAFVSLGLPDALIGVAWPSMRDGLGLHQALLGAPVALAAGAYFVSGLFAGRLVLGLVVERLGQVKLIRLATVGVLLSAGLFAIPGLAAGAVALPLLSFSLASIYPGLMTETPRRVGAAMAPHAVGFQVSAATLGIAVVPSLAGLVSEHAGLRAIAPMIACCALVLFLLHERLVATADKAV